MTTISTSSENLFSKIQKYLKNKRVGFTSSLSNEAYALTIFDLSDSETTTLIQKMTKHFHLIHRQQEPLALAAEFILTQLPQVERSYEVKGVKELSQMILLSFPLS